MNKITIKSQEEWDALPKSFDHRKEIVIDSDEVIKIKHDINNAHIFVKNNNVVELYNDCYAKLYDNSQATLHNESSSSLFGNSQATLYDQSTADAYDDAKIITLKDEVKSALKGMLE